MIHIHGVAARLVPWIVLESGSPIINYDLHHSVLLFFHLTFLDVFHPSPPHLLSGSRLPGGVTRCNRIIMNIAHFASFG